MNFPQTIYIEQNFEDHIDIALGHVFQNLKSMANLELECGKKVRFWQKKNGRTQDSGHYLLAVVFDKAKPLNLFEQSDFIVEKLMHKNPDFNKTNVIKEVYKRFDFSLEEYKVYNERITIEKEVLSTEKINRIKVI